MLLSYRMSGAFPMAASDDPILTVRADRTPVPGRQLGQETLGKIFLIIDNATKDRRWQRGAWMAVILRCAGLPHSGHLLITGADPEAAMANIEAVVG
jgi:hypothetical protein